VNDLIDRALAEDVGTGDITTDTLVPEDAYGRATLTQKAPGVIAGLWLAEAVFHRVDPGLRWHVETEEGEWREEGLVATVTGSSRSILTGERVALNFLQRMSGVASLTARYVQAVEGTHARILDTRKTTPGLRAIEKEAVLAGGGTNHRAGLYDAILVKENHATMAGGVGPAVRAARDMFPDLPLEVECRDTAEIAQALEAGAPRILLDNMDPARLRTAVEQVAGRAVLEASGGMTLDTLREHAASGVDFISVGALTHSAPVLDLSLLLTPVA
jgi:nicotinate-nucleotide pyrophosphorylase (carboxylating)